jgi:nicotinamide-nucleotide amidase
MAVYIALKLSVSAMQEVNASIITIGDELLIGQTIDTNSAFIAQELNKVGIWVKRRVAVGDVKQEILDALAHQSGDCQLVIITGGLGPTADDITKPTLCEFFNTELREDEGALQNVTEIFKKIGRPLTERNKKQAEVPASCIVLPNKRGTAPGMWFSTGGCVFISLPGVPHEMRGLILDAVIPKLKEQFSLPSVLHRTLLTAGQGESQIADLLMSFEEALPTHIKLAYLPAYGLVKLRLTGRSANREELEKELDAQFNALQTLVAEWMVSDQDIPLQEAVNELLREKGKTLSTAESCTGGYIAHLITSIAGSSDVFQGSVVSYANEVKQDLLGVRDETLKAHGAVSEETVKEMVKGVLNSAHSDYAIATSGIMGPGGGSEAKPVGMVWIAVGNAHEIEATKFNFRFDRKRNIELTAHAALTMLYRFIKKAD